MLGGDAVHRTTDMTSKLITLEAAVSSIPDGSHLTFGGFGPTLAPMAFARALVRQGIRDLEVSAIAEAWVVDMLVGAGAVRRLRMSNLMFEGIGRCRNVSRAIEEGAIPVEDYSHFGLVSRLRAAGRGEPFATVRSMMGTDLERIAVFDEPKTIQFEDPFSGESVLLVPPLSPDVAVLHAARADIAGNVQLFGVSSAMEAQAGAARRVIVTVEEIVSDRMIRSSPEHTLLPTHMVDAIVWAPFGAHPTGMFRYYDPDSAHLNLYYEASRKPESFASYLESYARGPASLWEYMDIVGIDHLLRLRVDPGLGYVCNLGAL